MNIKSCATALVSAFLMLTLGQGGSAWGNCAQTGTDAAAANGARWIEERGSGAGQLGAPGVGPLAESELREGFEPYFAERNQVSLIVDLTAQVAAPLDQFAPVIHDAAGHRLTALNGHGAESVVAVYADTLNPAPPLVSGVVVTAREPRLMLLLAGGMALLIAKRKKPGSVVAAEKPPEKPMARAAGAGRA